VAEVRLDRLLADEQPLRDVSTITGGWEQMTNEPFKDAC
jgi:hypothetical protein